MISAELVFMFFPIPDNPITNKPVKKQNTSETSIAMIITITSILLKTGVCSV